MFADPDLSFTKYEEPVSSFSFTHDDLARGGLDFFGAIPEQIQCSFIKASKNGHVL
jgi:hypothetical protein